MNSLIFSLMLSESALTGRTHDTLLADIRRSGHRSEVSYTTKLFGKTYRLDDSKGLAAYIRALEAEIARSKREEPLGEARQKDPLHNKAPRNYIDKKLRRSMEEIHAVAVELSTASGDQRDKLRNDLLLMAGALRASYMRVLPDNMDVLEAMRRQGALKRPPVGLGKDGIATNLTGSASDPSKRDPKLPSSFWNKPTDIASKDLYYGFDRNALPDLTDVICTYHRSKQSKGVHGGFDVKCKEYGTLKIKFSEEYSQPFSHRIFWALGYNTIPVDYARTVKVKWDRRILTEFNTHQNESVSVRLLGIPIYINHLQVYLDPLEPVSEILMLDAQGKQVSIKPNPNWDAFKRELYKNPRGRPERIKDNFNAEFADRIQYLVYRNVNIQLKESEDEVKEEEEKEIFLGNWDWNGEGTPGCREYRAFVLVSAWLNQFDAWVHNNKMYLIKKEGTRSFKRYITDLGGCLGPASDATKMDAQLPNRFPWAFTRTGLPGETSIPLDGSYHNIRENETFKRADIYDARWIAPYLAQLTGKQILEALVASGLPSAQVRLYYNKLVQRRNKALTDLGFSYPPIPPMDESEMFDYDPRKDGAISIVTVRNETVTAPDDGWVVVHGQVIQRAEASNTR